jgi:hypothetical protein
MSPFLTVIIPTIGRWYLYETIDKIMKEFGKDEVVIFLIAQDVNVHATLINSYFDSPYIKVFLSDEIGVSAALNLGLSNWSRDTWLSIFSDDDVWMPGRKELIIEKSLVPIEKKVFIGKCEILDVNGIVKSSRIPLISSQESPIKYVYPGLRKSLNRPYLSLTSMLISPGHPTPFFRSSLKSREDLCWLEELGRLGDGFSCIGAVSLSRVHPGYARTIDRDNVDEVEIWCLTLESLGLKAATSNFMLWHFPKPFIRLGRVWPLLRSFWKLKKFYHKHLILSVTVVLVQASLALIMKAIGQIKSVV